MQEFYYNYIENKFRSKSKLLFTETDSMMYEVKSKDVDENFIKGKKLFDFSNYSATSKYYDDSKKLVVEKMKDETGKQVVLLLKNLLN